MQKEGESGFLLQAHSSRMHLAVTRFGYTYPRMPRERGVGPANPAHAFGGKKRKARVP